MNALIVDDDFFVVTALEKKIDWQALGIENVFTANNVAQAREIIMQHTVHVLISDIDMPQGSGLELLAWVREESYNIQTIFLTNYADFNYAQKAIELQSFEYFLKPIEFDKLTLIIQKAVARAREQQQQANAVQQGYLWQKNQAKIREYFWHKLINGSSSLPMKSADIARAFQEQNLPYTMTDTFQPLFIHFFPYEGSLGQTDKGLFNFAVLNVMYESFQSAQFSIETVIEYKPDNWFVILKWEATPNLNVVEELAAAFIPKANQYLKSDVCCNISSAGSLEASSQIIKQLLEANEAIVKCRNQIFNVNSYNLQSKADYVPPDLAHLEELLNLNQSGQFMQEAMQYLQESLFNKTLDVSVLSLFRVDMVQLIYSFLKSKGIQAHKLYSGRTNDQLLAQSLNSIEDMEQYLKYLVYTSMDYREFAEQSKSIVEQLKHYIHTHCGDDLTRNHLAEIVYLNPDYMARLFKKETGLSLGNYVIQARIAAAKHLLETTPMSVYVIAKKVGYTNYSYFSKLFKQVVGLSPNEYKRDSK